ncbi:hypothetical protein [Aquipuribacter nitratireducens]|uniref:O-antigen ligase n=1 Tax=Aquipuribacter nitratireducens TaxID=650104 RepID=A0ABW0GRN3_9MICO
MSRTTTDGSTTTTAAAAVTTAAAAVTTTPAVSAVRVAAVAVLVCLAFAGVSGIPRAAQLGVLVVAATALAVTALARHASTRAAVPVAAAVTLLVSVPVTRVPNASTLLLLVLAALAALGTVGVVATSRRALPHGTWLWLALVGVLAAATLLAGHDGGLVGLLVVALAAFPVFVLTGVAGPDGHRLLASVVVALACTQAVLALVEPWLFPRHLWAPAQLGSAGQVVPLRNEVIGGLERSQGTLGHPLPLGMLLLVALALAAPLLRSRPWLRTGVQGLLLVGIVMAGARTALLVAVLLLALASAGRVSVARVLVATGAVGVAVVTALSTIDDLGDRAAAIESSGSFQHRLEALRSFERLLLWQDLRAVLLGNGYGSGAELRSAGLLQQDGFAAVDNQLVLTLSQGGLVALGLLTVLLVRALLRSGPEVRPAVLACLAMVVLFDVLLWPSTAALLALVLGLAMARGPSPAAADPAVPATRAP